MQIKTCTLKTDIYYDNQLYGCANILNHLKKYKNKESEFNNKCQIPRIPIHECQIPNTNRKALADYLRLNQKHNTIIK